MKQYIGTKTVKATPAIKKGDKVYLHEEQIPKTMVPTEEGYKVVYPDGYESWSPKDVFEEAYQVSETYLDRLKIEYSDLFDKISKASRFINSNGFEKLSSLEQDLLRNQLYAMELYLSYVIKRISLAEGNSVVEKMNFGQAVEALKRGEAVAREGWNGKGMFIVKQMPTCVDGDIIINMKSLPVKTKELIMSKKAVVKYNNQCIIYNSNTGVADSWSPSISDAFAKDWVIVKRN